MSKIDDYRELKKQIEDGLSRFNNWIALGNDNHPRGGGYFISEQMRELEKTGAYLLMLEEHLSKKLQKAREAAEIEAAEFVREGQL